MRNRITEGTSPDRFDLWLARLVPGVEERGARRHYEHRRRLRLALEALSRPGEGRVEHAAKLVAPDLFARPTAFRRRLRAKLREIAAKLDVQRSELDQGGRDCDAPPLPETSRTAAAVPVPPTPAETIVREEPRPGADMCVRSRWGWGDLGWRRRRGLKDFTDAELAALASFEDTRIVRAAHVPFQGGGFQDGGVTAELAR